VGGNYRVLVTQAATSGRMSRELLGHGIEVVEIPTIRIMPPDDWTEVDDALQRWSEYDWIVFTSVNAVQAVRERLAIYPIDTSGTRISAVGEATNQALSESGLTAHVVSRSGGASALAESMMRERNLSGSNVLFPRSDIARTELTTKLQSAGALVKDIVVYRNIPAEIDSTRIRTMLQTGEVSAITFTSPSTAQYLARGLGVASLRDAIPEHVYIASIGPTTSAALQELGCKPDIEAIEQTASALADQIAATLREND
jgi:uroporphyrinogen III methyltransferase / synthase